MSRDGMATARGRLQETLEEMFPGALAIGAASYASSCSGGRQFRDFDQDGLEVTRKVYVIRVKKTLLAQAPEIGTRVIWTPAGGEPVALRVNETPSRPEDNAHALRCIET